MALKLYPPYIEGTIPAFYEDENGIARLVIPFSLNKANSVADITSMSVKIQTIITQEVLGVFTAESVDLEAGTATFNLEAELFTVNQFYKTQVAFVQDKSVGYYSTVGVVKFTKKPTVVIANLIPEKTVNNNTYSYTGVYSTIDPSEKLYSSRFVIADLAGRILDDSGEILHNAWNDNSVTKSIETFTSVKELLPKTNYVVTFSIKTTNGLEVTSPRYIVRQKDESSIPFTGVLTPIMNYDNAYVDLHFKTNVIGSAIISRAKLDETSLEFQEVYRTSSSEIVDKNLEVWERIYNKNKNSWKKLGEVPLNEETSFIYRDYTVEQGVEYLYAIQLYDEAEDTYSKKIISQGVFVDFEDAYLYDGDLQLRLRFNFNVSSFKTNILEQKTDTIGSKHPFIFRNGTVYYNEFPISGLITHLEDPDETFISKSELNIYNNADLSAENFSAERVFRNKVLGWLNNGQPKLFKSPAEGNFIVRLMNSSMSPTSTAISRLVYNFSSTAVEIADCNEVELKKYYFLK